MIKLTIAHPRCTIESKVGLVTLPRLGLLAFIFVMIAVAALLTRSWPVPLAIAVAWAVLVFLVARGTTSSSTAIFDSAARTLQIDKHYVLERRPRESTTVPFGQVTQLALNMTGGGSEDDPPRYTIVAETRTGDAFDLLGGDGGYLPEIQPHAEAIARSTGLALDPKPRTVLHALRGLFQVGKGAHRR